MHKIERLAKYNVIKKSVSLYSDSSIELGIMNYALLSYNYARINNLNEEANAVEALLTKVNLPTDIETIIELFEVLLDQNAKDANGIVFTPKYIADYIVEQLLAEVNNLSSSFSIVDPACGCGIFLVSTLEYLHKKLGLSINDLLPFVHGADVQEDNVRRCKLIIALLCAKYGETINCEADIVCMDSLKINWHIAFHTKTIDYILGNPPYVNPHDMNAETAEFLRKSFLTTKSGTFNIFYAFIECAFKHLSDHGKIGFILPNNLLTIKSASDLRLFLQKNKYVKSILDFGRNMIFKPIRTYNCIVILDREPKDMFTYSVMEKDDNIEEALYNLQFLTMPIESLDKNGWKLVDQKTRSNLSRIENQDVQIKNFIRTGIATLKDKVYFVYKDDIGFFKSIDNVKHYVEPQLIKPIYKVPELKKHDTTDDIKRFIIFPYVKTESGYQLIDETVFRTEYPLTYECLSLQRDELDARDKGKGISHGWYAYGRTQGLNKYGKKLLFPTFANKPKFILVSDEDSLFCNGYAVFENEYFNLSLLEKILNSEIMDYYVRNTSYSIEGGYFCYQKKYIERFSIPFLTPSEQEFILTAPQRDVNKFLIAKYNLS